MKKIHIGLIGLGYWGKNILRNLHELGFLHTACDFDPEVLRLRKFEFPKINYTLYYKDLIKNKEIDALVIATPAATHYQLVKEVLEKDRDVFVEKPLALSSSQGEELVRLANKKKKILMVGHILQYHPAIIKLKELIRKKELGDVQYVYSNRLNIGKLRVEENILWSFAPHDISAILELLGGQPRKVSCFGESFISKGIYDVTLMTMEFKDRIKAHIFVSWLHPFKEQKLVVVGSKAMAVFDDLAKRKLFIYPHKIERANGKIPVAYKAKHYSVRVEKKEPLKEELSHFVSCVLNRDIPKTNGKEAVSVLRVLEEAEKSLRVK